MLFIVHHIGIFMTSMDTFDPLHGPIRVLKCKKVSHFVNNSNPSQECHLLFEWQYQSTLAIFKNLFLLQMNFRVPSENATGQDAAKAQDMVDQLREKITRKVDSSEQSKAKKSIPWKVYQILDLIPPPCDIW